MKTNGRHTCNASRLIRICYIITPYKFYYGWSMRDRPYSNNKCFNENWRSLLDLIYLRTWQHVLHWIPYCAKSFFFAFAKLTWPNLFENVINLTKSNANNSLQFYYGILQIYLLRKFNSAYKVSILLSIM